jgi:hypothetical protein
MDAASCDGLARRTAGDHDQEAIAEGKQAGENDPRDPYDAYNAWSA